MIRHFGRQTRYERVEDVLHSLHDGTNHVILVEIFDHPDSVVNDGEVWGPWVLGPADEVHAWLQERGHEDYSVQYELGEESSEVNVRVHQPAPQLRQAPAAAELSSSGDDRPGITLTRDQLEAWVGRALTDDEVAQIDDCISTSSIPEAIGQIADQFAPGDEYEAPPPAEHSGPAAAFVGERPARVTSVAHPHAVTPVNPTPPGHQHLRSGR